MRAYATIGMQYGSEGKGLLNGFLAKMRRPTAVVSAWGPNAGHTFVDWNGKKYVTTMLPSGLVSDSVKSVFIGPGSVINPEALLSDLLLFERDDIDIYIHSHAAVVMDKHRASEAAYGFAIGSTMKGVGEAVIQKIKRNPVDQNVAAVALKNTPLADRVVSPSTYLDMLLSHGSLQIEGSQGFSLGIDSGFYPYCTSRECGTHRLLADCGVPASIPVEVIGVARTYPIRVANRYDKEGTQIGWSGPCYDDQEETTWEAIGVPAEYTTVTKLKRRVFTFSEKQIWTAIKMCNISSVFLNFVNYCRPGDEAGIVGAIEASGAQVSWLGCGPRENDILFRGF